MKRKFNPLTYKIKVNQSKKTYTIRIYDGKKVIAKYRSFPQDYLIFEWSQRDIKNFLLFNHVIQVSTKISYSLY